ncbi:MAG: hypothetical protein U0457_12850 [Candidatus Sericytochromatia bacterium]
MKNKINYLLLVFLFFNFSCSNQDLSKTLQTKEISKNNLGPTGGGVIDPKITSGLTIIDAKRGTSNLIFNINLTQKSFATKYVVKAEDIKIDNNKSTTSTSTTPSTTSTTTNTQESLDKVMSEITINGVTTKFEIPNSKFSSTTHKVNISNLSKDDTVSIQTKAYDKSGNIVGFEEVKDKKVTKDLEEVDVNLSINININITNTQSVNVTQTQTFSPNITINLPQPQQPSAPPQPSQIPPKVNSPFNTSSCLTPLPDGTVTLSDNSKVKICGPDKLNTGNTSDCYAPDNNSKITLKDGKTILVCRPPM